MFDFAMNNDQLKLREEAGEFTTWVSRELILTMDAEEWYKESLNRKDNVRDVESDAVAAFEHDEKTYE